MIGTMNLLKICAHCKLRKDAVDFYRSKHEKLGIMSICKECTKKKVRQWEIENRDRCRTRGREYAKAHREIVNERAQAWRDANREKRKEVVRKSNARTAERHKKWISENIERVRAIKRKSKKRHPETDRACAMRRLTRKANACPSWADHDAIGVFYAEAVRLTKTTGIKHEVDHILPLQGKDVCGLHVETNLRVIPKVENVRKGNRWNDVLFHMERSAGKGATA